MRETGGFSREISLAPREKGLARISGAARGWRETEFLTIRAVDHSNWPDLSEELDGIVVPKGLPDPRDTYFAVFLSGPIRVYLRGQRVAGGWRRKSLELLAYLAVHPLGAAKDQILEALWPEEDPERSQRLFWQSLSFLRSRLGRLPSTGIVERRDDLYRLDRQNVWVDVVALAGAAKPERCASEADLRFACDIYKGDFCEGRYFSWATGAAERLRSLSIDAARRLSIHLKNSGDLGGALLVLDKAISLDLYDEDLCRQAMVLEAKRGRRDQVVRRFRRLRHLLVDDLNVDPSPLTVAMFQEIEEGN